MRNYGLFINGTDQQAVGAGAPLQIINPATSEIVATVPDASPDDVDNAVTSARLAFSAWSQADQKGRSAILHRTARLINDRAAELAEIEVSEVGRTIREISTVDIPETAD